MARRDDVDGNGDRAVDRKDEDLEEVELDVTPLELLGSLARLDLEAALAYEAAVDASDEAEVAARLTAFAQDHRRHVDGLNALLQAAGEAPIAPPAGIPVLAGLVRLAGPLGPDVLVVALLGNEQLTNLSYDGALAYEWDEEVEALLQSYQADEERHLRWLAERHDRIGGHAEDAGSPGAD
jgi:rubrerythrin